MTTSPRRWIPSLTGWGLDVAILDLHALMDVAASRITKAARAEAFRFVYRCLAQYHRRQPEFATRLVKILILLDLHLKTLSRMKKLLSSTSTWCL